MQDPVDSIHVVTAMLAWARSERKGLRMAGHSADLFNQLQFHWRPDPSAPESHVTLKAELVDGVPLIRFSTSEPKEIATPTVCVLD